VELSGAQTKEKQPFYEKWYSFCRFVLKLAALNFLWMGFTLVGGVLFGIGPATIGLYTVLRQLIRGNVDVRVWRTFWAAYRTKFRAHALLGCGYAVTGIVLVTNLMAYPQFFSRVFFGGVFFFYLVSAAYLWPLLVHFELHNQKITQYIKSSLIIGVSYLQYTLMMFVALAVIGVLMLFHFGITLFFFVSVTGGIIMWFTHRVFTLVDQSRVEVSP